MPFASGRKAAGICDRCGQEYLLAKLRYEPKAGRSTKVRVCRYCYDADNPRDRPHLYTNKIDAIAVRDPRPENDLTINSLWGWGPVLGEQINVNPSPDGWGQYNVYTENVEYLLLEDGSFLVYETGDFISLE